MTQERNTISDTSDTRAGPTHMLAADLLVVDALVVLPAPEKLSQSSDSLRTRYAQLDALLAKLLVKKSVERGGKISIDEEEFRELASIVAGLPGKMEAGGATADIVTTVKNLRGDKVTIDFLGIAGLHGINDNLITEDLHKSGINLEPGAVAGARAAMSYIFTHPDGTRTTVTYPGNAAEKLLVETVTDARLAKSSTVLIPISLWSKFDASFPEALLSKSVEQDKHIILTIPKQARFDYAGSEDIHKKTVPFADVIVADEHELARWYKTGNDYEAAITQLQADMALRDTQRALTGKPPKDKPVSALVKHADDSATILVAASPPGITPPIPAQRYDIAAPVSLSGKKHTLGVDDAMYAGFIAALDNCLPPQQAGEFAMDVAQTKFLYDSVRIPSPVGADPVTQARWKGLRSGLDDALAGVGSAISFAKTGISNPVDTTLPRTAGQKAFDFLLYPLVANIGVFALSTWVTYHSNFNQNKANAFVKRSAWFKDQLAKLPGMGKNPQMVRDLNMVAWSFIDGSLMTPVVGAFESKRQHISRWIDDKLGTTPEDTSVYEKEIQRSWMDVIKARATTFAFVIGTYFALRTKVLPKEAAKEGILAETAANSGIFEREKVQSINGLVFDVPGKNIGGRLFNVPWIKNWAEKTSNKQLSGMAAKTGTVARKATEADVRYQIEGVANTGLFEAGYTSLTTAGLYFLGKMFASKRKEHEALQEKTAANTDSATTSPPDIAPPVMQTSWAEKVAHKSTLEKAANYHDVVDKSRNAVEVSL